MANANRTPHDEVTIDVNVTPTVERDYRRRNIFPELRLENTSRFINATGVHRVSIAEAEAILEDAKVQHADRSLPRGTPKAFSSLVDRLTAALKSAKGLWDDPGIEAARLRMQESPAQFHVGEQGRYWSEWIDDDRDGELLEIVEGYRLYGVVAEDGPFICQEDGKRKRYQWGYLVRGSWFEGASFCPAYRLQRLDYKRGHLRLVSSGRMEAR